MIVVAKKADFSENYFEKVPIKTVNEISDFTKDVLSVYEKDKDITDAKKIALDDFFVWLASQSYYSKIACLYMPILLPKYVYEPSNQNYYPSNFGYNIATKKTDTVDGYFYQHDGLGASSNNSAGGNPCSIKSPVASSCKILSIAGIVTNANLNLENYIAILDWKNSGFGASDKKTNITFDNVTSVAISRDEASANGAGDGKKYTNLSFNADSFKEALAVGDILVRLPYVQDLIKSFKILLFIPNYKISQEECEKLSSKILELYNVLKVGWGTE